MAFDWDKFRELAEELRQRDDEAAKRTSVSRLYYAVYWNARNLLEKEGFVLSLKDTSHKQIWNEYKKQGRTRKAIGFWGDLLLEKRVQADYKSEIEDVNSVVEKAFEVAEKTLVYLRQIQKSNEK